jgi:hypothetical protein
MVTGKQEREFLPGLRVEPVEPSSATTSVTLPGATTAFAAADIYAGATGYIVSRNAKSTSAFMGPRRFSARRDHIHSYSG